MLLNDNLSSHYPRSIAIIGGGRWSRVIVKTICEITSGDIEIFIFSLHNKTNMKEWLKENKFIQNVKIFNNFKKFNQFNFESLIVANAASDHMFAIQKGLNSKIPVLVEKPITLSYSDSLRMVRLAKEKKTFIGSAHVFLYSSYLNKFSRYVSSSKTIKSIEIEWADPKIENRYGEKKYFDPSLPIFFDLLPHVLSIFKVLLGKTALEFKNLQFEKGGSKLEFDFLLEEVNCKVRLARNSIARKRIVQILGDDQFEMDFSIEPGVINYGSLTTSGDEDWNSNPRPLARMLKAFLIQSKGTLYDSRLDVKLGLQANKLIDEVLISYNSAMSCWLKKKLIAPIFNDDDLKYALREILSVNSHSFHESEKLIDRIYEIFNNDFDNYWTEKLNKDSDPLNLLRKIALN